MPPAALRLLTLTLLLAATGCAAEHDPLPPPDYRALQAEFDALVVGRDSLFRSPASPLLDSARTAFDGLAYFPFDSSFAFRVRLRPELARDTFVMATSTGEARPFVRYGTFRFERAQRAHVLAVFRPVDDGPARLFLPFQDGTSGRTTYGGGRYLDLNEQPDGVYTLDFNQAYHPYCVFNPQYSCPVPPSENRLGLAVTAGERFPPQG